MHLLQLGLERFEVAYDLLKGSIRAQRLQLHKVTADVVQTHVGEPPPGGKGERHRRLKEQNRQGNKNRVCKCVCVSSVKEWVTCRRWAPD